MTAKTVLLRPQGACPHLPPLLRHWSASSLVVSLGKARNEIASTFEWLKW